MCVYISSAREWAGTMAAAASVDEHCRSRHICQPHFSSSLSSSFVRPWRSFTWAVWASRPTAQQKPPTNNETTKKRCRDEKAGGLMHKQNRLHSAHWCTRDLCIQSKSPPYFRFLPAFSSFGLGSVLAAAVLYVSCGNSNQRCAAFTVNFWWRLSCTRPRFCPCAWGTRSRASPPKKPQPKPPRPPLLLLVSECGCGCSKMCTITRRHAHARIQSTHFSQRKVLPFSLLPFVATLLLLLLLLLLYTSILSFFGGGGGQQATTSAPHWL